MPSTMYVQPTICLHGVRPNGAAALLVLFMLVQLVVTGFQEHHS
jgi:hypothetical protein